MAAGGATHVTEPVESGPPGKVKIDSSNAGRV